MSKAFHRFANLRPVPVIDKNTVKHINQKFRKLYFKYAEETVDPRWQFYSTFEEYLASMYDNADGWFEKFCYFYHLDSREEFLEQQSIAHKLRIQKVTEESELRSKIHYRKLKKYTRKTGKLYF